MLEELGWGNAFDPLTLLRTIYWIRFILVAGVFCGTSIRYIMRLARLHFHARYIDPIHFGCTQHTLGTWYSIRYIMLLTHFSGTSWLRVCSVRLVLGHCSHCRRSC